MPGKETDEYAKDKQAVVEKVGVGKVSFVGEKGFSEPIGIQAAVNATNEVDHIVLCLGEATTVHYNPQYDFGFWLSYTKFEHSNLQVE